MRGPTLDALLEPIFIPHGVAEYSNQVPAGHVTGNMQ